MALDTLQLSTNIGVGDKLGVDTMADGTLVQYQKILGGTAASEVPVYVANGGNANALRVTIASDCNWSIQAGVASIGTVGLDTGTNSVGTVGIDAGTNLIGSIQGNVAHDAVGTSVQPILGGAIAYPQDGTAAGTSVVEGDLTRLKADLEGRLYVSTAHPFAWSANDNATSAQTNTELKATPGAGLSLYVTDVIVSSLTAQTTTIVSDGAGTPITEVPIIYTGANGNFVAHFDPPIKAAANVNFAYTTTAAVATSVMINGYTA